MKTETSLEMMQRVYERWAEGDWSAGAELLSDDVVFFVDDPTSGPSTYHGPDGVTRYMREFLSSWDHVRHVAEEFVENGDRVFVAYDQIGTGKRSGVEISVLFYAVWTFRDRKVVRLEYFQDRDAALEAAGL